MDDHPALAVARRYFDVYASGDHDAIAACLADDVVWVIHGHTRVEGKAAYLVEVDRTGPDVRLEVTTDRYLRDGDDVVVLGRVAATSSDGEVVRLVFADVVHTRDGLIRQLDSYVVPVGTEGT
jgi:ketosteroid isomerase-like protein